MNNQFTKELKFMKRFHSEMQEIKNYIESRGNRNNQYEVKISEMEDNAASKNNYSQTP